MAEQGSEARNVRIALELVRVRDERQLWATTYNRVMSDIFEVQTEIAGHVVHMLGVELSDDERRRLRVQPTSNHEAYTLHLKGRYFWNKRTEDKVDGVELLPAGRRRGSGVRAGVGRDGGHLDLPRLV